MSKRDVLIYFICSVLISKIDSDNFTMFLKFFLYNCTVLHLKCLEFAGPSIIRDQHCMGFYYYYFTKREV